jgi:cyanobactin maturation PatA/PatG family protease
MEPSTSEPQDSRELPASLAGIASLAALTRGDPAIRIAVLDGPVDTAHPAFAQANLESIAGPPLDLHGEAAGHGTHVASLIFGQPGGPVPGVAPGCTGLLVPIFHDGQDGALIPCSQLDLARAIQTGLAAGAHIISISGGQQGPATGADRYLLDALETCEAGNVLVVAAAGNEGCECANVPAAIESVLAVGALNAQGEPLESSNWDPGYHSHGIAAIGESIVGAVPGGGIAAKSGTSFANALVAGVAALLLSVQLLRFGTTDARAVRKALIESASISNPSMELARRCLAGRLDIDRALQSVLLACSNFAPPFARSSRAPDRPPLPGAGVWAASDSNFFQPSPQGELSMQEQEITMAEAAPSESAVSSASPQAVAASQIVPAGCGCGGALAAPSMVYVLGQIAYDFGTEARRDSLVQAGLTEPQDAAAVVAFVTEHPEFAPAIIWLVYQDSTAIYAVQPVGAYAATGYERLLGAFNSQITEGVEIVSIPGYAAGSVTLFNGQSVPVIAPEIRGIYHWSKAALVKAVTAEVANDDGVRVARETHLGNFLDRVYYELRNLGVAAHERAINYSATNAHQIDQVFENAIKSSLMLDRIEYERSPICRPRSDCWDIKLSFFNPARRFEQAKQVYRFTVDVSDVIPVTVGKVRHWEVYQ